MSTRMKFDVYEAVILHDACLRYESGTLTRTSAVRQVSKILRNRAISIGLSIDDSFRNEAGISFQLSVMQHVVTDGKRGVAQHSKLFESVATMYESDRLRYDQTLKRALAFNEASGGVVSQEYVKDSAVTAASDPFLDYLQEIGIDYVDKRDKAGCLWLIGNNKLKVFVDDARKHGIVFRYCPTGGRATGKRSAWWTTQKTNGFVWKDASEKSSLRKTLESTKAVEKRLEAPSERKPKGRKDSNVGSLVKTNSAVGFKQWMMSEGLAESSARSYSSAINNIEQFSKNHGYSSFRFYGNDDVDNIKNMISTLFEDGQFIKYNDSQHNRLRAALKKFIVFAEARHPAVVVSTPSSGNTIHSIIDGEMQRKVIEVATDGFPNGIRSSSIIDKKKIKRLFKERYGGNAPDDEVIETVLISNGISWNGKIYLISDTAKKQIRELVDKALATGSKIIYYDELYSESPSFYTDRMVYSSEALKSVMESIGIELVYNKNYCATDRNVTIEDELFRAFGDSIRLTVEGLKQRLPYIPTEKLTPSLSISDMFVRVRAGEYACLNRIEIDSQDQLDAIRLVESEIAVQGFASLSSIDLTRTLGNNPMLSEAAIRDALFIRILSDRYNKKGQIVTVKGSAVSANDIMRRYCRGIDEATLNELDEFEKGITGKARNAILPIAFETMVRIDREMFVSDSRVMFDSDATDSALEFFVGDGICPIKAITSFNSFPYVGQPWTLYLLESYLARFSKKYSIMGGPARTDNVGAIYPRNKNFTDYGDLIAHVLANGDIELKGEAAANYLVRLGFVLRKTAFVRTAIERARTLREIKG